MLARARILFFLLAVGFAVYQGVKLYRKSHRPSPPVAKIESSTPVPKHSTPSASLSPFIDCYSWGASGRSVWGYGDDLLFDGPPDSWKDGHPVYHRSRGRPL